MGHAGLSKVQRHGRFLSLLWRPECRSPELSLYQRVTWSLLRNAVPRGAVICLLDERGTVETSTAFSQRIARWRDTGTPDVAFLIGGADGHPAEMRSDADHLLSFGQMVWPHMLARVMLAEQLYRAAAILAGTPYHRA